ncbi:MAG: HD domain-containing protein [Bacillota bacterium]
MDREKLLSFHNWFKQYVGEFYTDDANIQPAIIFKEKHTHRVCQNIVRIGKSLGLNDADLFLAEAIALFHDVGRFRQYTQYRTFSDRKSENHALLGLRELERAKVLNCLDAGEQDLIKKAIEYHCVCDLPPDIGERHLLFSRLVRDADKLDILSVVAGYYSGRNREENPLLESGLPDSEGYSPVLIDNLLHGRGCSYSDIRNLNDRKLLMLSWVYDINFPYTLSEVTEKGFIAKIVESLPPTGDIRSVYKHLQEYIALRQSRGTK